MAINPTENKFHILEVQANQSTAASAELLVAVFHHLTMASALRRMLVELDKMALRNSGQVSLINIIRPNAPIPDEAARKAMVDVFQYMSTRASTLSAVVFEGSGARASIIRSVVTGFSLFAQSTLPIKVFATVEEGLRWLGPRLHGSLQDNIRQVRDVLTRIDMQHNSLPTVVRHAVP